ncbi:MAG: hypothetical protein JWQ43_4153 [Glaciihabitans sp.]|nr:hypothetical protein [Glaciihabitans sp.]
MPSYRVTITAGAVRPGFAAASALPTAKAATAELTVVEAADLGIVAGSARIVVRFEAEDAELAGQIAAHTTEKTNTVVEVLGWQLTQRVRNRWVPL